MSRSLVAVALLATMLPACQREQPGQATAPVQHPAAGDLPGEAVDVVLEDTIETDPRFIIGISYPQPARQYPGLAAELKRYSDAARGELMEAVADMGPDAAPAPYDLSLSYTMVVETPRIVAVAGDGSSYTGGAHGNPLVARFVWLPERDELLRPEELIPSAQGWAIVSDHVAEQLQAALSQRVDADDLDPAERAQVVRSAGKMIEEGTRPDPDNFRQFEPVLAPDGRIQSLRFVFPPYQVGPYADGVQEVEVPASVLLPHVAPGYRGLFAPP
ncbi:DUF3298 and DUF4163 domain-containing protein [Luteimonas vadosa]